jgi:hypothetical protein
VDNSFNVNCFFIVTIKNEVLSEGSLDRMEPKATQSQCRELRRPTQPGHLGKS